jgi:hypothetical protein
MNNETETKWEDEEATLKGEPPEAPRSESDSAGERGERLNVNIL